MPNSTDHSHGLSLTEFNDECSPFIRYELNRFYNKKKKKYNQHKGQDAMKQRGIWYPKDQILKALYFIIVEIRNDTVKIDKLTLVRKV